MSHQPPSPINQINQVGDHPLKKTFQKTIRITTNHFGNKGSFLSSPRSSTKRTQMISPSIRKTKDMGTQMHNSDENFPTTKAPQIDMASSSPKDILHIAQPPEIYPTEVSGHGAPVLPPLPPNQPNTAVEIPVNVNSDATDQPPGSPYTTQNNDYEHRETVTRSNRSSQMLSGSKNPSKVIINDNFNSVTLQDENYSSEVNRYANAGAMAQFSTDQEGQKSRGSKQDLLLTSSSKHPSTIVAQPKPIFNNGNFEFQLKHNQDGSTNQISKKPSHKQLKAKRSSSVLNEVRTDNNGSFRSEDSRRYPEVYLNRRSRQALGSRQKSGAGSKRSSDKEEKKADVPSHQKRYVQRNSSLSRRKSLKYQQIVQKRKEIKEEFNVKIERRSKDDKVQQMVAQNQNFHFAFNVQNPPPQNPSRRIIPVANLKHLDSFKKKSHRTLDPNNATFARENSSRVNSKDESRPMKPMLTENQSDDNLKSGAASPFLQPPIFKKNTSQDSQASLVQEKESLVKKLHVYPEVQSLVETILNKDSQKSLKHTVVSTKNLVTKQSSQEAELSTSAVKKGSKVRIARKKKGKQEEAESPEAKYEELIRLSNLIDNELKIQIQPSELAPDAIEQQTPLEKFASFTSPKQSIIVVSKHPISIPDAGDLGGLNKKQSAREQLNVNLVNLSETSVGELKSQHVLKGRAMRARSHARDGGPFFNPSSYDQMSKEELFNKMFSPEPLAGFGASEKTRGLKQAASLATSTIELATKPVGKRNRQARTLKNNGIAIRGKRQELAVFDPKAERELAIARMKESDSKQSTLAPTSQAKVSKALLEQTASVIVKTANNSIMLPITATDSPGLKAIPNLPNLDMIIAGELNKSQDGTPAEEAENSPDVAEEGDKAEETGNRTRDNQITTNDPPATPPMQMAPIAALEFGATKMGLDLAKQKEQAPLKLLKNPAHFIQISPKSQFLQIVEKSPPTKRHHQQHKFLLQKKKASIESQKAKKRVMSQVDINSQLDLMQQPISDVSKFTLQRIDPGKFVPSDQSLMDSVAIVGGARHGSTYELRQQARNEVMGLQGLETMLYSQKDQKVFEGHSQGGPHTQQSIIGDPAYYQTNSHLRRPNLDSSQISMMSKISIKGKTMTNSGPFQTIQPKDTFQMTSKRISIDMRNKDLPTDSDVKIAKQDINLKTSQMNTQDNINTKGQESSAFLTSNQDGNENMPSRIHLNYEYGASKVARRGTQDSELGENFDIMKEVRKNISINDDTKDVDESIAFLEKRQQDIDPWNARGTYSNIDDKSVLRQMRITEGKQESSSRNVDQSFGQSRPVSHLKAAPEMQHKGTSIEVIMPSSSNFNEKSRARSQFEDEEEQSIQQQNSQVVLPPIQQAFRVKSTIDNYQFMVSPPLHQLHHVVPTSGPQSSNRVPSHGKQSSSQVTSKRTSNRQFFTDSITDQILNQEMSYYFGSKKTSLKESDLKSLKKQAIKKLMVDQQSKVQALDQKLKLFKFKGEQIQPRSKSQLRPSIKMPVAITPNPPVNRMKPFGMQDDVFEEIMKQGGEIGGHQVFFEEGSIPKMMKPRVDYQSDWKYKIDPDQFIKQVTGQNKNMNSKLKRFKITQIERRRAKASSALSPDHNNQPQKRMVVNRIDLETLQKDINYAEDGQQSRRLQGENAGTRSGTIIVSPSKHQKKAERLKIRHNSMVDIQPSRNQSLMPILKTDSLQKGISNSQSRVKIEIQGEERPSETKDLVQLRGDLDNLFGNISPFRQSKTNLPSQISKRTRRVDLQQSKADQDNTFDSSVKTVISIPVESKQDYVDLQNHQALKEIQEDYGNLSTVNVSVTTKQKVKAEKYGDPPDRVKENVSMICAQYDLSSESVQQGLHYTKSVKDLIESTKPNNLELKHESIEFDEHSKVRGITNKKTFDDVIKEIEAARAKRLKERIAQRQSEITTKIKNSINIPEGEPSDQEEEGIDGLSSASSIDPDRVGGPNSKRLGLIDVMITQFVSGRKDKEKFENNLKVNPIFHSFKKKTYLDMFKRTKDEELAQLKKIDEARENEQISMMLAQKNEEQIKTFRQMKTIVESKIKKDDLKSKEYKSYAQTLIQNEKAELQSQITDDLEAYISALGLKEEQSIAQVRKRFFQALKKELTMANRKTRAVPDPDDSFVESEIESEQEDENSSDFEETVQGPSASQAVNKKFLEKLEQQKRLKMSQDQASNDVFKDDVKLRIAKNQIVHMELPKPLHDLVQDREFRLVDGKVSDGIFGAIRSSTKLLKSKKLERLYLKNCGLSDDKLATILEMFSDFRTLKALIIRHNTVGPLSMRIIIDMIQRGEQVLTELRLDYCSMQASITEELFLSLAEHNQLTILSMAKAPLGGEGFGLLQEFLDYSATDLIEIGLQEINLRPDQYLELLEVLQRHKSLKHINLALNNLVNVQAVDTRKYEDNFEQSLLEPLLEEDEAALQLLTTTIGKYNQVQHFNLAATGLSPRMLLSIIEAARFSPTLQGLHLCGNPGVTSHLVEVIETWMAPQNSGVIFTGHEAEFVSKLVPSRDMPPVKWAKNKNSSAILSSQARQNEVRLLKDIKQRQDSNPSAAPISLIAVQPSKQLILHRMLGYQKVCPRSDEWRVESGPSAQCWRCHGWKLAVFLFNESEIQPKLKSTESKLLHKVELPDFEQRLHMQEVNQQMEDDPVFFKSNSAAVQQAKKSDHDDSDDVARKETVAISNDLETPLIYLPDFDFKPTKMIKVSEFCRKVDRWQPDFIQLLKSRGKIRPTLNYEVQLNLKEKKTLKDVKEQYVASYPKIYPHIVQRFFRKEKPSFINYEHLSKAGFKHPAKIEIDTTEKPSQLEGNKELLKTPSSVKRKKEEPATFCFPAFIRPGRSHFIVMQQERQTIGSVFGRGEKDKQTPPPSMFNVSALQSDDEDLFMVKKNLCQGELVIEASL